MLQSVTERDKVTNTSRRPRALKAAAMVATVAILGLVAPALTQTASAATKGGACKTSCTDTTAPTLSISSPAASATVAGQVNVAGSSSDNVGVVSVSVSVDGGAWSAASGTTSWSLGWNSATVSNGAHTLTARAADAAGNTVSKSVTVNVSNTVADTTAPTVAITSPSSGSSVSGTVSVAGSAGDNTALAKVETSIDGAAWQTATGTSSWSTSWATGSVSNGTHTIAARATDTSGNVSSTSTTVSVSNTTVVSGPAVSISSPANSATVSGSVSIQGSASSNVTVSKVQVQVDGGGWMLATGTSSWSLNWDSTAIADGTHTLNAKVTDSSGYTATSSISVTTSNWADTAPATQGKWISPEGVTITINSAGSWTIAQVYSILKANAMDIAKIGPSLTINVQDTTNSQTQSTATQTSSGYTGYKATMWLMGLNSTFASMPDAVLTHEYGHAWSNYWYFIGHQGSWSSYMSARWTMSDGSLTLATDSRTNSSYTWQVSEIIADDYRLSFGSSLAISENPTHMNTTIPDPRNVTGLANFLSTTWRNA